MKREVIEHSATGSVTAFYESPEERAERIKRRAEAARRALRLTPGVAKTLSRVNVHSEESERSA